MKSAIDLSLVEEMLAKTREEVDKMTPVNVMVVGKTGVGKSTLINSIFRENLATTGVGKPVTKHLQKIIKEGVPMSLVDTRGLELSLASQKEIINDILQLITENKKKGVREQIHVIYYCIQAMTARIEDPEIELITQLSQQAPVIIVLTQSLGTQAEEFKRYLMRMHLPVQAILNVMAQPYPIYGKVSVPAFGLMELLEVTYDVVPREVGAALTNVQQIDIDRKANKARFWVTKYIASTFGVGFVPVPFSDAAVLVPMQVTMLAHITSIFGMEMDKSTLIALVSVVGGTGGATFAGKFITSNLLKLVPGVGTVAGGVISGVTASMITTALAMSYIEVLAVMARKEQKGCNVNQKEIMNLLKLKVSQRIKQGGNQLVKELLENATDKSVIQEKKNSKNNSDDLITTKNSHRNTMNHLVKRWSYKASEMALIMSKTAFEKTNHLAKQSIIALERYQSKVKYQDIANKKMTKKEAIAKGNQLLEKASNQDIADEINDIDKEESVAHKNVTEAKKLLVIEDKQPIYSLKSSHSEKQMMNEPFARYETVEDEMVNRIQQIQVGKRNGVTTGKSGTSLTRQVNFLGKLANSAINKHHKNKKH